MLKSCIIVESPTKVEQIQKYVGDKYMVLSSKGHINQLAKGGKFGIGVNPLKNFKTFYTLLPDKLNFLDEIISNNEIIDRIIICSDPDFEGEAIAYCIAQYLKQLNKPILRAEFSEITKDGILSGLKQLHEIDYNKFKAQETRRILDRIVGFMVSPFLINSYGANLSAGRVQSVAMRLVVEREKEINKFQPEEFWNLNINLVKDKLILLAKYQGKISSQEEAEKIKKELEQPSIQQSLFQAISVSKKPKIEQPPPPLNTSKMQQLMASKFGIDGDRTMAAAQQLYELGFVSYIRTDSIRVSDVALDNVREWMKNNNYQFPEKPNIFKNKNAAQNAHEAIRPTNVETLPSKIQLASDLNILYKLIWTQFVASQMCPAIYDVLNVKITHLKSKHNFKINDKILISPGYLTLFEENLDVNGKLPEINEGDILKLKDEKSIILEQKFTQPPSRYTYASLLEKLENKGIGRPSTFATIIEKISDRHYVEKKGNSFHGTELGLKINDILCSYFEFMQYDYTSNLENDMDEIALNNKNYLEVLQSFYNDFIIKLGEAHKNNGGKICPNCSAPMYSRVNKNNTPFNSCALYPFCISSQLKIN